MDPILENIATTSTNPAAQRLLANRGPEAVAALLGNEHCDLDLFKKLYTTKGPNKLSVATAKNAVNFPLPEDKLQHVLSVEKRAGVLAALFNAVVPTMDEVLTEPLLSACRNAGFANVIVGHYGHELDVDRLAGYPGETFGPAMRVRRLLSTKVGDDDVIAELSTFDQWGASKYKALLSWVLVARPHLLKKLIPMPSHSVRTLVAGMSLTGLTPAEQADLLDLDKMDAKDSCWLMNRKFAWAAAAGNPTVDYSLIDLIEQGLDKAPQDDGPGFNLVGNRRNYNAWSISTFDREFEPATLARLIKWSGPSDQAKGRPTVFVEVIAHPSMGEADARIAIARVVQLNPTSELLESWLMPKVRETLAGLEARFPVLGTEATDHWDNLEATMAPPVLAGKRRLTDNPRNPQQHPRPETPQTAVNNLRTGYLGCVEWLDERLGTDENDWHNAFNLIPLMSSDKLCEFADMALAVGV